MGDRGSAALYPPFCTPLLNKPKASAKKVLSACISQSAKWASTAGLGLSPQPPQEPESSSPDRGATCPFEANRISSGGAPGYVGAQEGLNF